MRNRQSIMNDPVMMKRISPREKTHDEIYTFTEMSNSDKILLKAIKSFLNRIIPDLKIYLVGSRISGRWIESSDYDIIVHGNVSEEDMKMIRKFIFPIRTDFRFGIYENVRKVEIE